MSLTPKLELRQGQQLVMTPQLQQAIRLLQLSNMELTEFVDGELERNPLLEREETTQAAKPVEDLPREMNGETGDETWLDLRKPVQDPAGTLDTDFGNVFQEPSTGEPDAGGPVSGFSWAGVTQRMHSGSDDDQGLESYVASEVSLRDRKSTRLNSSHQ